MEYMFLLTIIVCNPTDIVTINLLSYPGEEACSEEDHEWNRRCEFVVVGWDYYSTKPL